jgi:CBS domain-containing protein
MSTQIQANIDTDKIHHILAASSVFGGLSDAIINELILAGEVISLGPEMDLFRPGDAYQGRIYVLLQGNLIQHYAGGHDSHPQPGHILGLANYLDHADYSSHVRTITRCQLLAVDADKFQAIEDSHPELFNAIQNFIAQKLRSQRSERGITGVLAQPVNMFMKTPLASCTPDISIRDAFKFMDERHIGSLVVKDDNEQLIGVLTYHGLAKALLVQDSQPDEAVIRAACEKPQTVAPDTPLWRVENQLKQYGLKYLIVYENGQAIGMVSQTDILRALTSHPGLLTTQIPEAKTVAELGKYYNRIVQVAVEAREGHHRPSAAVRVISETHLAIQRRVVELTLQQMPAAAPGPYAVLIMGSGGRREMLLNPDQDNGIILADNTPDSALPWFEEFTQRMNENLDRAGYILCPGDIMARNPMYRKRLKDWKKQINRITSRPNEKAARWSNIVFDFDTLYGDELLTASLRRHVLSAVHKKPQLLHYMTDHDAEGRPAIDFFKRLRTTQSERGNTVDVKRNGLRIIADATRIFALQSGVAARSTPERLNALVHLGKFSSDFMTSVIEAYEELLDLLLEHQIEQAGAHQELDKFIDPKQLTDQGRNALQMAMRSVKRLQDNLQKEFGTEIF